MCVCVCVCACVCVVYVKWREREREEERVLLYMFCSSQTDFLKIRVQEMTCNKCLSFTLRQLSDEEGTPLAKICFLDHGEEGGD